MPADAETILAIKSENDDLKRSLYTKIDEVAEAGRQSAEAVRARIDQHEQAEAGILREVTNTLSGIQQEIRDEKEVTRREITRLDGMIDKGEADRRGIWKWIVGASSATGLGGGFLAKFFGGGSGP